MFSYKIFTNIKDVEKDKINILEALALAGDLNITGRRNNVMLIRTQDDGSREIVYNTKEVASTLGWKVIGSTSEVENHCLNM